MRKLHSHTFGNLSKIFCEFNAIPNAKMTFSQNSIVKLKLHADTKSLMEEHNSNNG